MTFSEWLAEYCEDNDITLPTDIPNEKTALELLSLMEETKTTELGTNFVLKTRGAFEFIDFNGYVPTKSTFTTLTPEHRPKVFAHGIGRWKNTSNTYYPCLINVSEKGVVSASYFNGTTASSITNGTIVGSVCWITG